VLKSWTIFAWGENAQLYKWSVSSTDKLKYFAQSHEYASVDIRGNPPGGECTGSGNGADASTYLLACRFVTEMRMRGSRTAGWQPSNTVG
jgi:hypothetical protein